MRPTAEILTVGDELLRGDLQDTNGCWLAARLGRLGFEVTRILSVGDALGPLQAQLERAAAGEGLIVVTGGLGPTEDDRTAEAVARATRRELELDEAVLEALKARFAAAGYPFSPNNAKQACFPRTATVIANERGTAPGFMLRTQAARIVCLPGVPWEMRAMFEGGVVPLLEAEVEGLRPARVRVIRTFGKGESQIDHRLRDLLSAVDTAGTEVSVHYRTTFPENHVILVVRGEPGRAGAVLDALEQEIRSRVGRSVYGVDDTSFSEAVVQALREAGATLALAESCTGGLAGDLITRASGSSEVFHLGVVTYANAFKHRLLGVPEAVLEQQGAVSQECVEAMARGVRQLAGTTYGVSISGVAGPTGGTADKPVGTVHFALATEREVIHLSRRFPFGDRQRIKEVAAHVALSLVLRHLAGALRGSADPYEGRWAPKEKR
jgi:nicotinamide-nucleotide amidase